MDLGPGLTELGVAGLGEDVLGGRTQLTALVQQSTGATPLHGVVCLLQALAEAEQQ